MSDKICKTAEDWQQQLTPEQFSVTRQKGTERAFTGKYHDCKTEGTYHCVCCGAPLFGSAEKFDSGSGWPSYWQPVSADAVHSEEDLSHGMKRVEIQCAQCQSHLGHIFEDGPQPTGLRYCINSISLNLKEKL